MQKIMDKGLHCLFFIKLFFTCQCDYNKDMNLQLEMRVDLILVLEEDGFRLLAEGDALQQNLQTFLNGILQYALKATIVSSHVQFSLLAMIYFNYFKILNRIII